MTPPLLSEDATKPELYGYRLTPPRFTIRANKGKGSVHILPSGEEPSRFNYGRFRSYFWTEFEFCTTGKSHSATHCGDFFKPTRPLRENRYCDISEKSAERPRSMPPDLGTEISFLTRDACWPYAFSTVLKVETLLFSTGNSKKVAGDQK